MAAPFDWIAPDLALGGCFKPLTGEDLRRLGVGAVIDLRAETRDDAEALERCGLVFLHLPTADLQAVSQESLDLGVAFAEAARSTGRKLLVHCQHGVGRSALLALCILVARGAGPAEALAQAKDARWQVSPSPAQYEAWAAWLRRRGSGPVPDFDAFAAVAYRHLAMS